MRPGAGPAAEPPSQLTRITAARRPQRVRRNGGRRRAASASARRPRPHSLTRSVGQTQHAILEGVLTTLRLRNFRGFEDHVLPLRPMTLIVGRNNAGKSSVVEALRLVSLVTTRLKGLGFHDGPDWGGVTKREVGVRPSIKGMEINFASFFHRYSDPPAIIEASFDNSTGLRIYIGGEDRVHAVILDPRGQPARGKGTALNLGLPTVEILPQVTPLEPQEVVLTEEYVRRAASSNLASRHFRNQLRVFGDNFAQFAQMVEDTWPGLRVVELRAGRGYPGDALSLTIRDGDFVAEASAMGHGLQMWLQTMWFLARVNGHASVILDEPDVYMHPDLQRRLVRYLKGTHQQVVIATHSVEMMSEVEPDDILVVDRRRKLSKFATSTPEVQRLVDHVGSAHNLQLARLWNARKCLLVEGDDVKLLSLVHQVLFPSAEPLENLPHLPVGGWTGWPYAVGSAMLLKNAGGETIAVYSVFDSDYHSTTSIAKRYEEAARHGVRLHVWERKEIENYLLVPEAIVRAITARMAARAEGPTIKEVSAQFEAICEELKDDVFDAMAAELLLENRAAGATGANREARRVLNERWRTKQGRLATVSGKQALSKLSTWSQKEFGASLSASIVIRHMNSNEIPDEMRAVVGAVEHTAPIEWKS